MIFWVFTFWYYTEFVCGERKVGFLLLIYCLYNVLWSLILIWWGILLGFLFFVGWWWFWIVFCWTCVLLWWVLVIYYLILFSLVIFASHSASFFLCLIFVIGLKLILYQSLNHSLFFSFIHFLNIFHLRKPSINLLSCKLHCLQ